MQCAVTSAQCPVTSDEDITVSSVAFLIDLTHRGRSIRADREQRAGESRQRKGRSRSGGSGSHTHQLDIGTVCSVRRSKKVHTRAPRLRQRVATPHHQARSSWAYGRTTCPSCSRSACSCARCAVKLVATGITSAVRTRFRASTVARRSAHRVHDEVQQEAEEHRNWRLTQTIRKSSQNRSKIIQRIDH